MGILEDLKKQAHVLLDKNLATAELHVAPETNSRKKLSTRLGNIQAYLHEFVQQLNIVNPATIIDFPLLELGTLKKFTQSGYSLKCELKDQVESVILIFSLRSDEQLECGAQNLDQAKPELRNLPVELTFMADYQNLTLELTIENFAYLGTTRHPLDPNKIDEAFLEELGKFILRKDNTFLQQKTKDDNLNDEVSATLEINRSRINSLFHKKTRLFLTYNNKIDEISFDSSDIFIGRGNTCNIVVQAEFASREHLRIEYRKGNFVLIDQSTNGTFVKVQGGKEVFLHQEELPLSGSGLISLGKAITVGTEHLIYFSCQ